MIKRKVPIRMCVSCREMHEKKDLIRIVKSSDGNISCDITGKAQGRGAYLCSDLKCMEKAMKSKILNRVLDCNVSDEIFNDIKRVILRREIGK